jgi:hypothetical protein
MDRDETVLLMLDESRPMIYNLSAKLRIELEECMQEAAYVMLATWDKVPAHIPNKKAYLHRCIRNHLYKLCYHRLDTCSLDEPIAKDNSETFADMLQAFVQSQDTEKVDHIIDTVHEACRELMLEEQEYCVHAFEMNAYEPVAPAYRRPGLKADRSFADKKRSGGNIGMAARRILRKNPQLQGLMQRETAVL